MADQPDRRTEIMAAAFEAFAENGYDKTTMDDIVQRSGLSKGTLYWHFKNKHDLYLATLNWVLRDVSAGLEHVLQQTDVPAVKRIRSTMIEAIEVFVVDPRTTRLMMSAFLRAHQSEEARTMTGDVYLTYITLMAELIQQGIDNGEFGPVDPMLCAAALVAGGDGIMFHMLFEPPWSIREAAINLLDLTLAGMRKENTGNDTDND